MDSASIQPAEPATTIMFRNIPRKHSANDVVAELDLYVTRDAFDFVYIPWFRNSSSNMGYAFVNFTRPAVALALASKLQGTQWSSRWPSKKTPKIIRMVPASVQGFTANLQQFELNNSASDDFGHYPRIFQRGIEVDVQAFLEGQVVDGVPQPRLAPFVPGLVPPSANSGTPIPGLAPVGSLGATLQRFAPFGSMGTSPPGRGLTPFGSMSTTPPVLAHYASSSTAAPGPPPFGSTGTAQPFVLMGFGSDRPSSVLASCTDDLFAEEDVPCLPQLEGKTSEHHSLSYDLFNAIGAIPAMMLTAPHSTDSWASGASSYLTIDFGSPNYPPHSSSGSIADIRGSPGYLSSQQQILGLIRKLQEKQQPAAAGLRPMRLGGYRQGQ